MAHALAIRRPHAASAQQRNIEREEQEDKSGSNDMANIHQEFTPSLEQRISMDTAGRSKRVVAVHVSLLVAIRTSLWGCSVLGCLGGKEGYENNEENGYSSSGVFRASNARTAFKPWYS